MLLEEDGFATMRSAMMGEKVRDDFAIVVAAENEAFIEG